MMITLHLQSHSAEKNLKSNIKTACGAPIYNCMEDLFHNQRTICGPVHDLPVFRICLYRDSTLTVAGGIPHILNEDPKFNAVWSSPNHGFNNAVCSDNVRPLL